MSRVALCSARFPGTCYDSFLKNKVGTYSCHDEEYRGGTQGFIWLNNKIRTSETIKLCADGGGLKAGDPLRMGKCIKDSESQLWDYEKATAHVVNRVTKLCLDPMRFDKAVYPDVGFVQRFLPVGSAFRHCVGTSPPGCCTTLPYGRLQ